MKRIFLTGLLAISAMSFAQMTRFVYQATMKPSKEKDDKISEIFHLDTSREKSVFYSEKKVQRDSTMQRMRDTRNFDRSAMDNFRDATNFIVEKDLVNQNVIFRDRIGRDNYIYTETPTLDWKLSQETTQIGDYKVQKAEAQYAGRQWIAWFATELPSIDGPYKFYGLPGLIVKIEDTNGDYSFDLKEVKNIEDFVNFDNGFGQTIKITKDKFKKLQKNYLQDPASFMNAERMSSGNRPPNGGGGRNAPPAPPRESDSERKDREKRMNDEIKSKNNPIELE